ncbi:hypothetical protein DFP72DRAFT_890051 [Ephemerocybe angulata]|uniref:DUF6534 domain-containing protein n=1 Tax=Ephemerocybe angulata TaxID=980116 RepID=A0A8H6I6A9_9AGAR|nr:hypothetical protein DFP72DRAFT_890051 [Tulosesus angulatus]
MPASSAFIIPRDHADTGKMDSTFVASAFGPALWGTFVACIMYGYTCYFTARYFRHYANDRKWFKGTVASLWVVDTLITFFSMDYCFYYLARRYGEPEALSTAVWSLQATIFFTCFPPAISNVFYLTRLQKIGYKNVYVLGGISCLILLRLALELTSSFLTFKFPRFDDNARYKPLSLAYCSISSIADLTLAVLITRNLLITRKVMRAKAGYKRSDKTIDGVVMYMLCTGILTSVVCAISLLAIILIRDGLVDKALHGILGKLYVISVLTVLNCRESHVKEASRFEASAFGVGSDTSSISESTRGLLSRESQSLTFSPPPVQWSLTDNEKYPRSIPSVYDNRSMTS